MSSRTLSQQARLVAKKKNSKIHAWRKNNCFSKDSSPVSWRDRFLITFLKSTCAFYKNTKSRPRNVLYNYAITKMYSNKHTFLFSSSSNDNILLFSYASKLSSVNAINSFISCWRDNNSFSFWPLEIAASIWKHRHAFNYPQKKD